MRRNRRLTPPRRSARCDDDDDDDDDVAERRNMITSNDIDNWNTCNNSNTSNDINHSNDSNHSNDININKHELVITAGNSEANASPSDRALLRVKFDDPSAADGVAAGPSRR